MNNIVRQEWVTIADMQEILGIGRTKAYELLSTGDIPAVKIGRALRVNRAELNEWLQRNRYRAAG